MKLGAHSVEIPLIRSSPFLIFREQITKIEAIFQPVYG